MTSSAEIAILYGGRRCGQFVELRRQNGLSPVSIHTIDSIYFATPHRDSMGRPIYALTGTEKSLNLKKKSK